MKMEDKIIVVEVNQHHQKSFVWTSVKTVSDFLAIVSSMDDFWGFILAAHDMSAEKDFTDVDGDPDWDRVDAWVRSLPLDQAVELARQYAGRDVYALDVYFSVDDALKAGAPMYMLDEDYKKQIEL